MARKMHPWAPFRHSSYSLEPLDICQEKISHLVLGSILFKITFLKYLYVKRWESYMKHCTLLKRTSQALLFLIKGVHEQTAVFKFFK